MKNPEKYLYVLVLRYPDNDEYQPCVKIGSTDQISNRIKKIATTRYPADVEILCAFDMTEAQCIAYVAEKNLHDKYRPNRIAGEWFRYDGCFYDFANEIADYVDSLEGKEIAVWTEDGLTTDRPEPELPTEMLRDSAQRLYEVAEAMYG